MPRRASGDDRDDDDSSLMSLHAINASSVAVYFIDQQLVRMDVGGRSDELEAMLDAHYVKQDLEWVQGPDQIRIVDQTVQWIDTAAAMKIPKLLE